MRLLLIKLLASLALLSASIKCEKLSISPHDVNVEVGESGIFYISFDEAPLEDVEVLLYIDQSGVIQLDTLSLTLTNTSYKSNVTVHTLSAGKVVVTTNSSVQVNSDEAYVRVNVQVHDYVDKMAVAFGWLYFVCWTSLLYPQMYMNFRRKSVLGFSMDYLVLNLLGTLSYSVYNLGLYFIDEVQNEYFAEHEYGIDPIQPQDIAYAVLAFCWTGVCGLQGIYYNRDTVSVSKLCLALFSLGLTFDVLSTIIAAAGVISWLDCLYYFSYLKLAISFIKYIPQVFTNYKKKNTIGLSVGFAVLDFAGGSFSIMQMFLRAFNYDDWSSIFGNPTKFLLGLVCMFFDVCLLTQHFLIYRKNNASLKKSSKLEKVSVSVSVPVYEVKEEIKEIKTVEKEYGSIKEKH